jgi:hypothetical protein
MTKFGFAAAAAIAALLGILGFSGSAQAYPDIQQSLTVDHQVVFGGDSFTATASANVDCAWGLEWNGQAREGASTEFTTTYTAPQVTAVEKIDLVGTCEYVEPASGAAKATAATWRDAITITVRPGANAAAAPVGSNSADLPGTGGPNRVFLVSGLVLLLSGATAVTVARRRAEEAELPVQTA